MKRFTAPVFRGVFLLLMAVGLTVGISGFSRPALSPTALPDLTAAIPAGFAGWEQVDLPSVVLPAEIDEEEGTATLYRAYRHDNGAMITLVVVYGGAKGDTVRLHQPRVCYTAQGFELVDHRAEVLGRLDVSRMIARRSMVEEHVTYWMRMGDRLTQGQADQQWANIQAGLGQAADSTLVRISTNHTVTDRAFDAHDSFARDLLEAVSPETYRLLTARNKGGDA